MPSASMAIVQSTSSQNLPSKGELYELSQGLVSQYAFERKDAIERVIAAMTIGKDVSPLFTDVLKNIATRDIIQKKLVYLYLINYAKSHPDLCILAVNTFVQDSNDPNPLIRALAIRTMGCIRVEKILDFLTEPLHKTLTDESSYVRKTAAICVAKLFDLDAERCIENRFLEKLKDMLSDPSPIVVANIATALADIHAAHPNIRAFDVDNMILKKLLIVLNECPEWGRISILEAISRFESHDAAELEHICERIIPQLQHANAGVVMAALKVILRFYDYLRPTFQTYMQKKLTPPLISLITSSTPEIQYSALRNISLLLQKFPNLFLKEFNCFFCKYDDPHYVKVEKLNILTLVINKNNFKCIISELKEYIAEVDVEFVRRAIKCIGLCALRLECSAGMCVQTLRDLIRIKVSHVFNECAISVHYIMQRYPNQYLDIANEIAHMLIEDELGLDDPESRAAFIWVLGEYTEQISGSRSLLSRFAQSFTEEPPQVQLQLLTAVVKMSLKNEGQSNSLLDSILQRATLECDDADIRDRAFIYRRLMSDKFSDANRVILRHKVSLDTDKQYKYPNEQLNSLLADFSSIASVYHKLPSKFLKDTNLEICPSEDKIAINLSDSKKPSLKSNIENLLDLSIDTTASTTTKTVSSQSVLDLFGSINIDNHPNPPNTRQTSKKPSDDILNLF